MPTIRGKKGGWAEKGWVAEAGPLHCCTQSIIIA